MPGEAPRAAFFDLALVSWESFEAARAAIDRHRDSGDLLVLMAPHHDSDPEFAEEDNPQAGATVSDLLAGGDDCLRIAMTPGTDRSCIVVETMMKLGVDAWRCFGYGDHQEALRTLGLVGNPRVVGDNPQLIEYARAQGWPIISATASAAG